MPGRARQLRDLGEYRNWYRWLQGNSEAWARGDISLRDSITKESWAEFTEATAAASWAEDKPWGDAGYMSPPQEPITRQALQMLWNVKTTEERGPSRWCYYQGITDLLYETRKHDLPDEQVFAELPYATARTKAFEVIMTAAMPNLHA